VTLLTAVLGMLSTRSARAAPFELTWSAPPSCPSHETIVAATRERLGEGETSEPPDLYVRGLVTTEGAVLVVDLQVRDVGGVELGERRVRFEGRSCKAIAEPVALVLATMIAVARPREGGHEATVGAVTEPEPSPSSTPGPTPSPAPSPARRSHRPAPPPSPRVRVPMTIGASAVASFGLLPHAGFGGALRYTMTLPSKIAVLLGAEGSFETSPPVSAGGGEAIFRYVDVGGLAGVRVARTRWLELVPLVEGRAGLIFPSATGFPLDYGAIRFSGVVGAGVLGRIILREALRLDVMPSLRSSFACTVHSLSERALPSGSLTSFLELVAPKAPRSASSSPSLRRATRAP